jgi:inorganic pyrophosphatase
MLDICRVLKTTYRIKEIRAFRRYSRLSDFESTALKQIESFFVNYQKVRDVEVISMGYGNSEGAKKLVARAMVLFRN